MTHYLPAYTRARRNLLQAACGEYVRPGQHSAEPDCAVCQAYVLAEADFDAAMEATASEPIDPTTIVRHVEFDPLAGYRPKR